MEFRALETYAHIGTEDNRVPKGSHIDLIGINHESNMNQAVVLAHAYYERNTSSGVIPMWIVSLTSKQNEINEETFEQRVVDSGCNLELHRAEYSEKIRFMHSININNIITNLMTAQSFGALPKVLTLTMRIPVNEMQVFYRIIEYCKKNEIIVVTCSEASNLVKTTARRVHHEKERSHYLDFIEAKQALHVDIGADYALFLIKDGTVLSRQDDVSVWAYPVLDLN